MTQFIFYFFAVIAVLFAALVVILPNPVHSVLSLIVTFFAMACIWMSLQAEFLSLILLLVYVGAVMTLFLFVVMMFSTRDAIPKGFQEASRRQRRGGDVLHLVGHWPLAGLVALSMVTLLVSAFYSTRQQLMTLDKPVLQTSFVHQQGETPVSKLAAMSNTEQLGFLLFSDYAYPTEIAGVLLLVAMIAAIALVHRPPKQRKRQLPYQQIATASHSRIRLIKMDD